MASSFGVDINADPDLDDIFVLNGELNCLAADLLHRLQCPRGQLWYDLNYGLDIRRYLGTRQTSTDAWRAGAEISAELKQDERVEDASAVVTFNSAVGSLEAAIEVDTAQGPFVLVVTVTPDLVTLTRLEEP